MHVHTNASPSQTRLILHMLNGTYAFVLSWEALHAWLLLWVDILR
jgi:hypothetical protein